MSRKIFLEGRGESRSPKMEVLRVWEDAWPVFRKTGRVDVAYRDRRSVEGEWARLVGGGGVFASN